MGSLLAWIVRAWLWLVRVRVHLHPAIAEEEGPLVWAFWHGSQMALLSQRRRRPTAVLVSLSKDGELQSKVMRNHGMLVVRGSSSRRGAAGLRGLLRHLALGHDVAFAVDGPRGPIHRVKPGVLSCGAKIVPVGAVYSCAITLRSWDRFQIPLPFSRVDIVAGEPLPTGVTREGLEAALTASASATATATATAAATATATATASATEERRNFSLGPI